jgi:hypothetical protein
MQINQTRTEDDVKVKAAFDISSSEKHSDSQDRDDNNSSDLTKKAKWGGLKIKLNPTAKKVVNRRTLAISTP